MGMRRPKKSTPPRRARREPSEHSPVIWFGRASLTAKAWSYLWPRRTDVFVEIRDGERVLGTLEIRVPR